MSCTRRTPSKMLEKQHRPVRRPDLTFSAQDHTVSTQPGRTDDTNPSGAAFIRAMREGSRKNGIKVFDLGDPDQGISHVVAPELGMVLPGATHAVPDSHASTVGGLGALAFGCGTTELGHILATQVMAMKRPKRMLVRLDGRLAPHVTAKDVALRIIAEIGVSGARGHVVEYAGSAARAMPIEQRMTLCNLNIEMGGRSGFVAARRRDDSNGSRAGHTRRRARCGTARWRIGVRSRPTMARRSTARWFSIAAGLSRRSPGAPTRARCSASPAACPIRPPPPTAASAPRWKARWPTWACSPAWRSRACR